MRFYGCSGFGHRVQECCNSRRQRMKNSPYRSTRKFNEYWKGNDIERMKSQRTGAEDRGHSQIWMKKVGQLTIGDHFKGNGSHMANPF